MRKRTQICKVTHICHHCRGMIPQGTPHERNHKSLQWLHDGCHRKLLRNTDMRTAA
jgi:hypothetical protein